MKRAGMSGWKKGAMEGREEGKEERKGGDNDKRER